MYIPTKIWKVTQVLSRKSCGEVCQEKNEEDGKARVVKRIPIVGTSLSDNMMDYSTALTDSQYRPYYGFQQGSEPRYIPMQRASCRPTVPGLASPGGADMVVTPSNQSTHSRRSGGTDTTDLSAGPKSYDGDLASFDYEMSTSPTNGAIDPASSSFSPGSYGQTSQASFGRREYERRETPSTLGWTKDYVLVELYNFVVIKGKEPYLELQAHYSVTAETPDRVYLDSPKNCPEGTYPCQFPGCQAKKPFNRPADLERHYRNVHASTDQRERFECDYPKCDRATEPFTRKDHYRDHLRDYHKEDLGQPKRAKKEDVQKWKRAQESWLVGRNISGNWWRCAKCLSRVRVDHDGWECRQCNRAREPDLITRREGKREHYDYDMGSYDKTTDLLPTGCTICSGALWIKGEDDNWLSCPRCDMRQVLEYSYEPEPAEDMA